MAFPQTPEEMEGVVTTPEQPAAPEQTPLAPEAVEPAPEPESVPPSEAPAPEQAPPITEANPAVPEELASQVQELVDVAFNQGVDGAIDQARKTGNAALVDALHATLSETEIRKALESRGKLKPASK